MKYNHLNVPNQWKSYWTRYPEGHTILEALIQWVSQVDEMVDSYNELTNHVDNFKESVNNTTDGFREELNTFLGQFDDNLQGTVTDTLSDWQSSGFLDIVIDQALDTKYHEMDDRLTTQLAQTLTQRQYHYYVGVNQKYNTITSAYNQWVADGKPKAVIEIAKGEYIESIFAGYQPNLSFIGEHKDLVTWRTTTGYYKDAPLHFTGGVIKGITFIADITDNPSFTYVPLQNGDPFNDNIGSAYGLHSDFAGGASTTIIEDCRIISYVNAGLGCGTKANQTVELKNNEIASFTPNGFDDQAFSNGAFVLKSDYGSGIKEQKMILHNNKIYSENGKALQFLNQSQDNTCELFVEFQNNNLETKNGSNLVTFSSAYGLEMYETSFGNNSEKLNFHSVTNPSGYTITTNDLNTVKQTSYFHGGIGTANIPLPSIEWIGQSIAYSNDFVIQYAYQFTDKSQTYKRYYKQGVWSTWRKVTESAVNYGEDGFAFSPNANSANNSRLNGVYKCTVDVPTEGVPHVVQVIAHDANYLVQYAWQLSDMTKHKRTLINNVWGTWTAITEA